MSLTNQILNMLTQHDEAVTIRLGRDEKGYKATITATLKDDDPFEGEGKEFDAASRCKAVLSRPLIVRAETKEALAKELDEYVEKGGEVRRDTATVLSQLEEGANEAAKAAKAEQTDKASKSKAGSDKKASKKDDKKSDTETKASDDKNPSSLI